MHSKLKHHPVMVDEILSYLAPEKLKPMLIVLLVKADTAKKY